MTVGKNIKGIAWKTLEILYDLKMINHDGSYRGIYRRYEVIGTSCGEFLQLFLDYHPEQFDTDIFSPQDYYN